VSCELISGYELELFVNNMNQTLLRQVGASGTYYIIKDEDKLEGREPTHVQVASY
jgi:hypothetical protein